MNKESGKGGRGMEKGTAKKSRGGKKKKGNEGNVQQ